MLATSLGPNCNHNTICLQLQTLLAQGASVNILNSSAIAIFDLLGF